MQAISIEQRRNHWMVYRPKRRLPGLTRNASLPHRLIALSLHSQRIEVSGIRVEKRYLGSVPIMCHGGELRQVLVNAIGNAIEAMAGSGTH